MPRGGGDENARAVVAGRSLELDSPPEIAMESLLEKLKLLGYEAGFCRRKRPFFPPLTRTYFAFPPVSNNSNEQFFYFTSLTSWLLGLVGRNFAPPQQFDDPNIACNNILVELKDTGFATPSFTPVKLRMGHGEAVCGVLDALADLALERSGFAFQKPMYLPDAAAEEEQVDDLPGDEVGAGGDIVGHAEEEEEEEEAYMEGERAMGGGPEKSAEELEESKILESKVDASKWKMELERVAPSLRVTVAADTKDWRTHLEHAHTHLKTIEDNFPETKAALERVGADVAAALDKIGTRENSINNSLDGLTGQYREQREKLLEVQAQYNKSTDSVAELTNELAHVAYELEQVKNTMAERGDNIADTSPLVKIKTAMKKLKAELKHMELQIGVARNTVLQVNVKSKDNIGSLASKGFRDGALESDEDDYDDEDDMY